MTSKTWLGSFLISILILVLCMKYAQARNEYLTNGFTRCQYGSVDVSTNYSQDDTDYRHYSPSNDYDNFSDRKELRLSFRKFLGVSKKDCEEVNKIQKENAALKQELEMLKVCSKYAGRELPPQFSTVAEKCRGLMPAVDRNRNEKKNPAWDDMKKEYRDANPGIEMMDDALPNIIKGNNPAVKKNEPLKIPKYLTDELPVPTDQ
jgi:hypothetical protein